MSTEKYEQLARDLVNVLGLAAPPIAITFGDSAPAGVQPFGAPTAEPTAAGRTGRVPAGCVFWMRATEGTFTTVPEDHGNCSVGMLTHGLLGFEEAASCEDVQTILQVGWVTPEAASGIPRVSQRPAYITYGPLASMPVDPDVVLVRPNARGLMILMDSLPGTHIEGKPQCHIVAMAKEHGQVAASSGCALSRARTGMPASEMSCAIPGSKLEEVVDALQKTAGVDTTVAQYAAVDSRRFA